MKKVNEIIKMANGKEINTGDYSYKIRDRLIETQGRYLEIGRAPKGFTCHHIIPYASCRCFWKDAKIRGNDADVDKYIELGCNRDMNIIDLPKDFHEQFHYNLFDNIPHVFSRDMDGKQYVSKRDMNEYLIESLNILNEQYSEFAYYYDDLHLIIKEYAIKTVDLLGDDGDIKSLADDLSYMSFDLDICENVRYIVDMLRRAYL